MGKNQLLHCLPLSSSLIITCKTSKTNPKEHDPALPDPSDSKWDHFRDIKALEHKIGETIKLPDLSSSDKLLPKELQPHKLQSIILTPQRYKGVCGCGPSGAKRRG
ncbi:hypothetical protein QOT17_014045 [Balamuthia mandrillaris]